jgi:16S rRNA (cytidine1402-2'-O)-methyltransferase
MAGTLFVIATPIGNLEDVTARALRVLREVSLIAAEDTRHTARLLTRYGIVTPTTSLHEHNEQQKTPALIDRLLEGVDVAVVSDAGTPGISDPGSYLIRTARERGIRVSPVPGASALTALLSVVGVPSEGFHFLGFPPTRAKDRLLWLDRLANARPLAVFYEAPHRVRATLREIAERVGSDLRVIVGRELTKSHEELVDGPILEVSETLMARGEFVIAIKVGHMDNYKLAVIPPTGDELRAEFSHMTNFGGLTRRGAISALARKYALSARHIYSALEATKGSVG